MPLGEGRWREAVAAELRAQGHAKDAERFELCGKQLVLRCGDCSTPRLGSYWCERKCCPSCQRRRAAATVDKWLEIATGIPRRAGYAWVLITLTLTPSGDLRKDYARLLVGWRKLLQRWRRAGFEGAGGFRSVEVGTGTSKRAVKHTAATGIEHRGGNVHLHTLAYLPYIPQAKLSLAWLEIAGSSIVDIRAVKGPLREAMQETAKYMAKWTDYDPATAVKLYIAFRSCLPFRSWGVCYGTGVVEPDFYQPCAKCGCVKWWPDGVIAWPGASSTGPP